MQFPLLNRKKTEKFSEIHTSKSEPQGSASGHGTKDSVLGAAPSEGSARTEQNTATHEAASDQLSSPAESNASAKPQAKKKRKKRSAAYYWGGLLMKCACVVLVVWIVQTYIMNVYIHYGNNMYPAVRDGDLVIMNRFAKYDVSDVVAFSSGRKCVTGRIVAMEGDVIDISESMYTINGATPAEEAVYPTDKPGETLTYPYTVPEGCVFILNDFRSDTDDSRTYGPVSLDLLEGEILLSIRRRGF